MLNYLKSRLEKGELSDKESESIYRFWAWSQRNPNPASREMLFEHCKKYGIQITPEGMLVLYRNMKVVQGIESKIVKKILSRYKELSKSERSQYVVNLTNGRVTKGDAEKGKYVPIVSFVRYPERYITAKFTDGYSGTMDYRFNVEATMPREDCDETQATCSRGLHLASASWLKGGYFGDQGVVCLVNPMNIVSAPMADNYGKIRCCAFLPVTYVQYDSDRNIIEPDLDDIARKYGDTTLQELKESLVDLVDTSPNDIYQLDVMEVIEKYKDVTDFTDIEMSTSKFDEGYEEEDQDYELNDAFYEEYDEDYREYYGD